MLTARIGCSASTYSIRHKTEKRALVILVVLRCFTVLADDPSETTIEVVREQGKSGPRISAKVGFQSISLGHQLVDMPGADGKLPLELGIRYRVLQPAPVVLKSTILGDEVWKLCHLARGTTSALEQFERIDLSRRGEAVASTSFVTIRRAAAPPPKGLLCLLCPGRFRVSRCDDTWLRNGPDTAFWRERRPLLFQGNELIQKLTFTMAVSLVPAISSP